jgi:hypothetical protein
MDAAALPGSTFASFAQEVVPGVYLGSEDAGTAPLTELRNAGITHVLIPAFTGVSCIVYPSDLCYLQYNVPDVAAFPLTPLLPELIAFIE